MLRKFPKIKKEDLFHLFDGSITSDLFGTDNNGNNDGFLMF